MWRIYSNPDPHGEKKHNKRPFANIAHRSQIGQYLKMFLINTHLYDPFTGSKIGYLKKRKIAKQLPLRSALGVTRFTQPVIMDMIHVSVCRCFSWKFKVIDKYERIKSL
jgi:hypothetical protein